jgi:hypothetical protein
MHIVSLIRYVLKEPDLDLNPDHTVLKAVAAITFNTIFLIASSATACWFISHL